MMSRGICSYRGKATAIVANRCSDGGGGGALGVAGGEDLLVQAMSPASLLGDLAHPDVRIIVIIAVVVVEAALARGFLGDHGCSVQ